MNGTLYEIEFQPQGHVDDDASNSLSQWIRSDADSRRMVKERWLTHEGHLGLGELILVGVFAQTTLTAFLEVIKAWVARRPSPTTFAVRVEGMEIEVTVDGKNDVAELSQHIITVAEAVRSNRPEVGER